MTKTFVLLFKQPIMIYTYTTLSAVFEEFTKEELGVSLSTLQKRDFSTDFYENEKVRVEMSFTKTKGDIIREKEKFL